MQQDTETSSPEPLPCPEVAFKDGELRRRFERDPIPERFCYVEEDGVAHDIRIDVLFDGRLVERRFPSVVLESSINGASILLPADLQAGTLVRVMGVEMKTGASLFESAFRIIGRKKWLLLPTATRAREAERQSNIADLESRFRGDLLHRYGLSFLPGADSGYSMMNELYRAYLQSLYMEYVIGCRDRRAPGVEVPVQVASVLARLKDRAASEAAERTAAGD